MMNVYDRIELREVSSKICDNYCRYPREYDEELEGQTFDDSGICDKCPLNNLISKAYYKELGQMKNKKIKTNLDINNLPDYPLRKFTVFRLVDCDLWFYGTYDNEHIATMVAEQLSNAFIANTEGA